MKTSVVFLVILITGCLSDSGAPIDVLVNREGSQITIRNLSSVPIHYVAFERQSLALIRWVPVCSQYNQVMPSKTAAIVLTDDLFRPSNEAVVYWWDSCVKVPNSNMEIGEELHSVIVKVR